MKELKKIKHTWSILCEKSVIDVESNNLSLQNIIEELQVDIPEDKLATIGGVKNILFRLEIVTHWNRDTGINEDLPFDLMIRQLDPDGEVMHSFEHTPIFPKGKKRLRQRIKMESLLIKDPGTYVFEVLAKEDKAGDFILVNKINLDVKLKISKKRLKK